MIMYYSDNEEKMKHILAKCGLKSVEKIIGFVLKKRRSSECFADVWKCCVVPEREYTKFEHLQRVPF